MAVATTTGTWSDISTSLPRLTGINTNQLGWGMPVGSDNRQSSYRFVGNTLPLKLDGSEFVLGTFTHNNFPIQLYATNRFTVKLNVNVTFDEGGYNRNFSFTLAHLETPNVGNRRQQADRVTLSSVESSDALVINGESYMVEIVGFKQDNQIAREFISYENEANSAVMVAKLVHLNVAKPEKEVTYTFNVLNQDGSVFGKGCFTYRGSEVPVDLAHVLGRTGRGNALTSFWYHDPLVGSLSINELLSLNFVNGVTGTPSRFTFNAANVPEDSNAIAGGIATPGEPGRVSVHRNGTENSSCAGRKLTFPGACYQEIKGDKDGPPPKVDLVVVIDTSTSMRPEAVSLSDAVNAAIKSALAKCPSDLKVCYLGIEGRFAKTLFATTIREHLISLGVAESAMRGRVKGTVPDGGAQEDGGRAIEDISRHYNWRANAKRAIFYLGDEGFEGGDDVLQDDIDAATKAIDVATTASVRVHTYLSATKAKPENTRLNEQEFKRVADSTGGQFFKSQDALGGFTAMLEKVICASKAPPGGVGTEPCPCTRNAMVAALAK